MQLSITLDKRQTEHVRKMLSSIPDDLRKNAIKSATTKALAKVRTQARRNIPKRGFRGYETTGLLRKAIEVKVRSYRTGVTYGLLAINANVIGTDREGRKRWPIKYAHLVEFGVKPHSLKMKKNQKSDTRRNHPGFPGRGFMRKAFDKESANTLRDFEAAITKWMNRNASKIAARSPR